MHFFKPISECKIKFTGTTNMTANEVAESLKPFYVIAIKVEGKPDTLCKTPPVMTKRELICFNAENQRIGIPAFNIPCKLTLESSPSEIKEAIEIFYRKWADWDKQVTRKQIS